MNDQVIFKYKMDVGPNERILPVGSSVVHFAEDPKDGELYAWIMHAVPGTGQTSALYRFQVHPTGVEFDAQWSHTHTTVTPKGLVWHLLLGIYPQFSKMDKIDRSTFYAANRTSQ